MGNLNELMRIDDTSLDSTVRLSKVQCFYGEDEGLVKQVCTVIKAKNMKKVFRLSDKIINMNNL